MFTVVIIVLRSAKKMQISEIAVGLFRMSILREATFLWPLPLFMKNLYLAYSRGSRIATGSTPAAGRAAQ